MSSAGTQLTRALDADMAKRIERGLIFVAPFVTAFVVWAMTTWTSSLVEPLRAATLRIEQTLATAAQHSESADQQIIGQDKRLTVLEELAKRAREERVAASAHADAQLQAIQATQQKQGESLAAIAATLEIIRQGK